MDLFTDFSQDISGVDLPDKFTFPFYYEPHPLARLAASELKNYLRNQKDFDHNFGFEEEGSGLAIGKMFGVLVVKNRSGRIGYLRAFSGKLANKNHHRGFVPPVFDMLINGGFFRKGEEVLNRINEKIDLLEKENDYLASMKNLADLKLKVEGVIAKGREKIKAGKRSRKAIRSEAKMTMKASDFQVLEARLRAESIRNNYEFRDLCKHWKAALEKAEDLANNFQKPIDLLKKERREGSSSLQKQLFRQYTFLNAQKEEKSLLDIFERSTIKVPPAGAGECAAPKLLQYAFSNHLKPLALAEFWWGKSPSAEVRKSGFFYPACRGKCEPILGHMLSKTETDPNPMLENPGIGKVIKVVFEDDDLAIIVKPAEFLSVPGKNISDSVYIRVREKFPSACGPLIVHRLDMSTSGLMVIAKTPQAYKFIQEQFIKRRVEKTYVAILEGLIEKSQGMIDLPLRVDLNDRPRQLVCYDYGKPAQTKYVVIATTGNETRIRFYPITGRTHQLRVHAAHVNGLGMPIKGDDLYGKKGKRLHLHAEKITFAHPRTREKITFTNQAPF